jgi:hypothetical protein
VSVLLLVATACGGAPETAPVQTPVATPRVDARGARVEALLGEGRQLLQQQRPRDAESKLRQAIDQAYGFGAPWSYYRADALSELARAVLAQGRTADAQSAVVEALALLKPGALDADQRISVLETTRAEALLVEGQTGVAVKRFAVAAQAAARHSAELAPAQVAISLRLAETLQASGRRLEARMTLERSLEAARNKAVGAALAARFARELAGLYDATESANAQALLAELAPGSTLESRARQAAAPEAETTAAHELVALQADFRACYRTAALDHADVAGRVALMLSVEADGHVSSVKADASNLPVSAIDCLKRRALLARFDPPKGGATVITVPVTFVKQEND